jgi:microcompartment protein CcmK/EutM
MRVLSEEQAYLAMFAFLEAHYELTKADDVGALLGGLSLLPDGQPADPACRNDWKRAVDAALNGRVDARFQLLPP